MALHGGPGLSHEPMRALDPLATGDRCVLYFDQRGVGDSTRPEPPWSAEDLAADIDAVRAHWGFKQVDLVGHSWGAYLAALYTSTHRNRVGRLVYSSPAPLTVEGWDAFEAAMRLRIRRLRHDGVIPPPVRLGESDDCGPSTRILGPAYLFDPEAQLDEAPSSCSTTGYARTWAALPKTALLSVARRVGHRGVLLQGEGEANGPAIVAEWTRFHAGKLQVEVIESCGHVLHTECPSAWVSQIEGALDGAPGRTPRVR